MDHPVFEIPAVLAGRLFAMPCPSPTNLSQTLSALHDKGVTTIVSMLPQSEAEDLGVSNAPAICASLGIAFRTFPIPDFGLPETTSFQGLVTDLLTQLQRGESIAVHCRAGIGRTGMTVAAVLITAGRSAD